MRISENKIKEIKLIMKDQFGKELTDEEAQLTGLAVMQFVIAKFGKEYLNENVKEEELDEFWCNYKPK